MAMNWACISVGNPGNGAVERLTPRKPPSAFTNRPPPTSSTTTPARLKPSSTASIDSLWAPTSRSEEHTSELQSLMRISYAVFCLKTKKEHTNKNVNEHVNI